MVVQLQVLSVNSVEMAPCLLLSTESQRFLINVGDGTQRMCMEHRVRLAKLKHVFLTQLRAHTLGGLPGMVLTVSDTGKDAMRVFGPPGTQRYLTATRHFLFRPDFALQGVDLSGGDDASQQQPCYSDSEVLVYAVVTGRAKAGVKRKLHASTGNSSSASGDASTGETLPPPPANDCVSYVVETQPQRGKFLVAKAAALGVPKGKLFGQLHQGKDVTLPDGRVVRSADCVTPTLPAAGCAVVACPSVEYVDELVRDSHGGFRRYQHAPAADGGDAPPEVQLEAVFHLADPDVLQHPKYTAWAARFGPDVEHVLLSHGACPRKTVYRASATLQAQLQSVFPRAFPSADSELQDAATPFSRRAPVAFAAPDKPAALAESMLKFTLAPAARRGFDASACWRPLDLDEVRASTAAVRERLQKAESSSTSSRSPTPAPALPVHGRITFLGTGCAIPSKYRNVTGMYLEIEKPTAPTAAAGTAESPTTERSWDGIMFDCGEGSFGQLLRYANGDMRRLRALVNQLRCVWISHNHADHHLGVVRMLSERSREEEPLLVIGPTNVELWLDEYSAVDPSVAGTYRFVDNFCFDELDARFQEAAAVAKATRAWLRETLGVTQFECVPVKHSFLSYALVATLAETLKVAFSGDCRPSERFAAKAHGAFLMVHEATFEDALAAEAKSKCHCTTAEAITVGQRAGATHLILTHFSQRYPKMPVMESGGGSDVLTAIDLLSLRFDELHQPQLMDICSELMALDDADACDDDNDDTGAN